MLKSIQLSLLIVLWNVDPHSTISHNVTVCHSDDTCLAKDVDDQPGNATAVADHSETNSWSKVQLVRKVESRLASFDGVISLLEAFNDYVLPQPTTPDDVLDGVKRLQDRIQPEEGSQYKNVEDAISRALVDMSVVADDGRTSPSSNLQIMLWLERARFLNANIVLLMEGLLGRPLVGADLLANIQQTKKCDVVAMWQQMERYRDLITNGTTAVHHFSRLGQMSPLELSRRTAAVAERNVRIVERNVQLANACLQRQLNETRNSVATTDQLAQQSAKVLSDLYASMRWIVAVHATHNETGQLFKPKLSARHAFDLNGFHVALFPFALAKMPVAVDGWAVDEFCRQPIREAGGRPICGVGSKDGEYIYHQLRHLGIVPRNAHLIVVPTKGQLSIGSGPPGSLFPFFAKRYPDFDIVAF